MEYSGIYCDMENCEKGVRYDVTGEVPVGEFYKVVVIDSGNNQEVLKKDVCHDCLVNKFDIEGLIDVESIAKT